MKREWALYIIYVFAAVCMMTLLLVQSSCSSPKVVTVTEYRDRVQHDTLTQVDSVYVGHYVREKGDTVWVFDTIFKYKYLDKYVYEYAHDSVPYAVEVQVPVRMRNGYDKFVSWGFWVLVLLILLRIGWWAFKKFYLHK